MTRKNIASGCVRATTYNFQKLNEVDMQELFFIALGYIIHDAMQPTVIGKVLDKVSLPGDLIVSKSNTQES